MRRNPEMQPIRECTVKILQKTIGFHCAMRAQGAPSCDTSSHEGCGSHQAKASNGRAGKTAGTPQAPQAAALLHSAVGVAPAMAGNRGVHLLA